VTGSLYISMNSIVSTFIDMSRGPIDYTLR
jgi:hypothetical protein